ncbi:MAG: S9 family peptidase, partial [Planctomycetota bacterium]
MNCTTCCASGRSSLLVAVVAAGSLLGASLVTTAVDDDDPPTPTPTPTPTPPVAAKRPVPQEIHNDERIDEYAWIREKSNPEVIEYLEAENAYTEAMTAHTEALADSLYDEMLGRIKQTDLSVPYRKGPFYYYSRTEEGASYPIYCRKRGSLDAEEEVYLDINQLAEGLEYFSVTARDLSPDQMMLAYATDTSGYETVAINIKNLATGETVHDVVTGAAPWGVTWGGDGKTIFYMRFDESKRANRIYRHTLGTDSSNDVLVAREDDVRFSVGVQRSRSDEVIFIGSNSSTTSEVRVLDAANPTAEPRVLIPRRQGVLASAEHRPG